MCFSAEASFATTATLAPVGVYNLYLAREHPPLRWLAAGPLIFAVQQAAEGGVWLALAEGSMETARLLGVVYLLFVALWPFYLSLSLWKLQDRLALLRTTFVGAAYALVFFAPVLLFRDQLDVHVHERHVVYGLPMEALGFATEALSARVRDVGALVYLGVLCWACLRMPQREVLVICVAATLTYAVSMTVYYEAFISVWCFYGAWMSLLSTWVVRRITARAEPVPAPAT